VQIRTKFFIIMLKTDFLKIILLLKIVILVVGTQRQQSL